MPKVWHEVRDGIHGFVRFNNLEKELIDSAPFQRLRCIHQLAMCYQVYPGATHRRFEHSLGVMEMATRIFDNIFGGRLADDVHHRVAHELVDEQRGSWRRVVRVAGLLHEIADILRKCRPIIEPEDVVDLSWDVQKRAKTEKGFSLTPWKTLLNEIITG